jgi:hypothetical protein
MRQFCSTATALMVMAFAGSMAYGEGERIDPGRADRTSEKTVDPGSRIWAEESGDFIHDRQYIIWEAEADDFIWQEESGDFIHDRQYIIWEAEADDFFWKRTLRIWEEEAGDFIWQLEADDF